MNNYKLVKRYFEFINESKLLTSDIFIKILKSVDSKISKGILELIEKDDINTPYNAIDVSDKDNIKFTSDSQIQNKLKDGLEISKLFDGTVRLGTGAVGRTLTRILNQNNIEIEHNDVLDFVPKWKAAYTEYMMRETNSEPFSVVTGEEIRDWYLEVNYCHAAKEELNGSISKSCMRFEECQEFLDIYTCNPDKISLVILTEKDKKTGVETLRARGLLWKCEIKIGEDKFEEGYYLDRVYYTSNEEVELMINWVTKKYDIKYCYHKTMPKMMVKLNPKNSYYTYPYMDSMCYYDTKEGVLYNWEPIHIGKQRLVNDVYYLQDTDGGWDYTYFDESPDGEY